MSTPATAPHADREAGESSPCIWLFDWLTDEHDAILDRLTAEVLGELPELAFAPRRPEVHVREAIGAHLGTLRHVLSQPGDVRQVMLPAVFDDYTRRLARDETPPLPVLLRSFDKIHANFWEQLLAALHSTQRRVGGQHRAELLEFTSSRLFQYFHSVATQTARAYEAARSLHQMRNAAARHQVVTRVLAGEVEQGEAELLLRHEFNTTQIAYVATFDDHDLADRLDTTLSHLGGRLGARHHLAMRGPDGCYGWFSPLRENWRDAVRDLPVPEAVLVCLGAPHEGLPGFRQSRAEALEGRRIAGAAGRGGVVLFEEVAHLALATRDLAGAKALVERELGRLGVGEDEVTQRLLDTLRVYLDELASPTRTARRMYVHPNTVIKRLERIEEYLGRPISSNSLNLRMAVELAPLVRAM
ncbi:PucR family transcriptional regulator [Mycolicibacterium phlei]